MGFFDKFRKTETTKEAQTIKKAKNVFIVEHKFLIKMIKDVLNQGGYHVIAETGTEEDAVEQFKANERDLDLIMLGITPPEIDGIQIIKAIREINREIPIIAMVSLGKIMSIDDTETVKFTDDQITTGEHQVIEAIRAGANDVISKPFKANTLLDHVKKAIGEP